jgi:hypothetical protein
VSTTPDPLDLGSVLLEDPVGSEPLEVQRWMLVAVRAHQIRREDHLVVEAVETGVETYVVKAELESLIIQQVTEVLDGGADAIRQRSVQPLKPIALSRVLGFGIHNGYTGDTAVIALLAKNGGQVSAYGPAPGWPARRCGRARRGSAGTRRCRPNRRTAS